MSRPRTGVSLAASLGALGVVFGDIGTSPLYTLKACFDFAHAEPTERNLLGIASLLIYAIVIVVCVKYIGFIMRVDDDGEGGILALLARLSRDRTRYVLPVTISAVTLTVIVGAAMLFGDGIITPAISVISAVEGIGVASSAAQPYIVPLSAVLLVGLFALQSRGTSAVGRLFGPVMLVWFVVIGILGAFGIARAPHVLAAFDPRHALGFVTHHGIAGFFVLGGVVLAVTGVEALYADLSHFGRGPIVLAWYAVVFPGLLLNYLGQTALVDRDPSLLGRSPFYALAPPWAVIPLVVLATLATIIASQALISGAFTLMKQAVALNLAPRVHITHTSNEREGQVYIPFVNVALAIGCVALVFAFRSSDRLAAAYGLAVAFTMLATSIVYATVLIRVIHFPKAWVRLLLVCFVTIDGSFVLASLPKFRDGGYLPLVIALVIATISVTWLEGRRCLFRELSAQSLPIADVSRKLGANLDPRATMVFLTGDPETVPFFANHRWVRDRAVEERLVLLTFRRGDRPYIPSAERIVLKRLAPHFYSVIANVGYMELPQIEPILAACGTKGLHIDDDDTSFFYADPKIERADDDPMPTWQRELFRLLARNAHPLSDDLGIRAERRIELGVTVRM